MSWDFYIYAWEGTSPPPNVAEIDEKSRGKNYFETAEKLGFRELVHLRSKQLNFATHQLFCEKFEVDGQMTVDFLNADALLSKRDVIDFLEWATVACESHDAYDSEHLKEFAVGWYGIWNSKIRKSDSSHFLWVNAF